MVCTSLRPEPPRGQKDRQKASFQQKHVPLEIEKNLSGNRKRQIQEEECQERNRRSYSHDQHQRKNRSAAAKNMNKSIAPPEPAKGREQTVSVWSDLRPNGRQKLSDGRYPFAAD